MLYMAIDAQVLEKPTSAPESLTTKSAHERAKIIATAGFGVALTVATVIYLQNNDLPGLNRLFTFLNPPNPQTEIQPPPKATLVRLKPLPTPTINRTAYDRVWPDHRENVVNDEETVWISDIAMQTQFYDLPSLVDEQSKTIPWTERSKTDARQQVYQAIKHLRDIGVDKNLIEGRMTSFGNITRINRPVSYFAPPHLEIGQDLNNPDNTSTIVHEIYHGFFEISIRGINEAFAAREQMDTGYALPLATGIDCADAPDQFDYFASATSLDLVARSLETPGQPKLNKTMIYIYQDWLNGEPKHDVGEQMPAGYFFSQIDKIYRLKDGEAKSMFYSKPALRCGLPTATPEPSKPPKIPPKGKTPTPAQQRPK